MLNATAAIAVATEEGLNDGDILSALDSFEGIGRRFQMLGEFNVKTAANETRNITVVDDYGHHPTEVDMTISAARSNWPSKRLVMVYQPHRFTRTRDLYEDFVGVLSKVDVLLLLDIYSASEQPIDGVDSRSLCRSIRQRGRIDPVYVGETDLIYTVLQDVLQDQDVLFLQGAGNIGGVAAQLSKHNCNLTALINKSA